MDTQLGARRIVVAALIAILMFEAGATAPAFATSQPPAPAPEPTSALSVPAEPAVPEAPPAAPDERVDLRSASARTFENADGSFTSELFSYPIHYQAPGDAEKEWVPIELGFAASDKPGAVAESTKAPVAISVGANKAAGGFLTLETDGRRIAFSLPAPASSRAADVTPTFSDNLAEWDEFLPGVNLRVIAGATGAKTFLVLDQAPLLPSWTFLIDAPGLTAELADDGSVTFSDADKTVVGRVPAPYAVDSSTSEERGGGEMTDQVSLALAQVGGLTALTIAVDAKWLADATYPVYVDPTYTIYTGSSNHGDAFVSSKYPTMNFADYVRPDSPYYHEHWLGQDPTNSNNVNKVLMKFDTHSIEDTTIDSAQLRIHPYHQYYNAPTAVTTWLNRITTAWTESGVTWNTDAGSSALTSASTVEGQTGSFSITGLVQDWADGSLPNHGVKLHQNGNNGTYWKRLISAEQGGSNTPRLVVTWHRPVGTPSNPTAAEWTKSRALTWTYADAEGAAQSHYQVQVSSASNFSSILSQSGTIASASARTWNIPTAVSLTNGTTYYWRVMVKNGTSWSLWSSGASFKWDGTPPGSTPVFVSSDVSGAITAADPNYYEIGNGSFIIRIRGSDSHSGIKLTYLRLYNATDEMRVSHDWSSADTTNCNEFNTSTLVDTTACARTYNSGGVREVQFTVVGLNQNTSLDIQYYFTDYAGNTVGYIDTGKNLIFDATPPTGSINAPTAGATVTGVVPITGTASDTNFLKYEVHYGAGASPSLWVDVGQNPRLTSVTNGTLASWDTAGLAAGTYTLRFRVYDKARVTSGMTTVTRTVTVDPGPPVASITSPTDGAFVAGDVDISGTASAASGFQDYTLEYGEGCSPTAWMDIGANPRTTAVSDGLLGSWDASGVSGEYAIRLVVSKTDDTTSSSTVCMTVDNEPPAVPSVTVTGDLVYQSEPNAPVYFGVDADLVVSASSTAGPSGVAAIRFGALSAPSGWTAVPALPVEDQEAPYEVVLTPSASAGDTSLLVAAISGAGVDSSDASIQLIRDAAPPTASFSSPAGPAISDATTTEVDWSATDAGSGVAVQTVQRQEADIVFAGSCTGAVWRDDGEPLSGPGPLTESLDDGKCHRWVLTVSDSVGNTVSVISDPVLADRTGPTLDFQSPDESTSTASATASAMLEWTAVDDASSVSSLEMTREVADKVSGSCAGATWSVDIVEAASISPALVVGLEADRCYRWLLEATDGAGNASVRTSGVLALDRVALAAPPAQALFFDVEQLEVITGDPSPISVEFLVDGAVIATDASAPFAAIWDTTTSANGPVTITLRASFASGPAFESSPIEMTVANQLSPEERVEADASAGRMTIDERAVRMVYALGAPGSLPARYHGPLDGDGHASASLQFLRDWNQLAPATRQEIEAFLDQPSRGVFYATPGGANVGATDPNFPECVLTMQNQNGGDVLFCDHLTAAGTFRIRYYLEGGNWAGGVVREDSNSNGVPDYVDRVAISLEDAWDEYTTLGYGFAPPFGDRIPVEIDALSVGGSVEPAVFPVIRIDHDQPDDREVYLARHELFHYMQYGYVGLADLANSYLEQWFWMEATAEWAAHQAQLAGSQQLALAEYYQDIGDYLGRPHLEFDHCECDWSGILALLDIGLRDREYGAFVFAEFLEERFNRDVIRQTWDAIAQNQLADEAIDDVAVGKGTTLRALLAEFARTVYLMDFVTLERTDWKNELAEFGAANPNEYTGGDEYGGPRPARTLVTMLDGPVENGELRLEEGGFSYVELAPVVSELGHIDVSVSRDDSDSIDATLLLLDKSTVAGPLGYPAVCDEIVLEFEDGLAQRTVAVNDGCATHAVLVLVHGEPIGGRPASVVWTATFDSGLLSNGTVQLGLNPHGHLIAEGSTPSSSGTLEVGLRYLSTQAEGLSHGCFCEGWGVADATTSTSGWANESWGGTGGLELIEFDKIFDTAMSRVRISDKLEVTHEVRPASGTQFLYEFEVTIQNISSQPTDIRYRRTIDWDIDPDPFDEYVTIDAFGGQPVPALAFSSNDGFAYPDPLAGPTDDGEVGFFVDVGPYDHGALFDFDFGSLAPGASRTFYLYYGAAPSRGDALTALGIVDAHLYSFGQTYNPDMSVNNSATTFIFAFKDPEAGGESLLGTAQASPEVVSEPSAGNRNEQSE